MTPCTLHSTYRVTQDFYVLNSIKVLILWGLKVTNSLRGYSTIWPVCRAHFDLQTKNGCYTSTSIFYMYLFVYYITYKFAYRYHSSCVYDQQNDDKIGWLFSINVHIYLFPKYNASHWFNTNSYLLNKFALTLSPLIFKGRNTFNYI